MLLAVFPVFFIGFFIAIGKESLKLDSSNDLQKKPFKNTRGGRHTIFEQPTTQWMSLH
jgi:hypothetical protein